MPKADVRVPKKAYSSPILSTYGTVEQLTQKVGLRKSNDGGKYPMIKTQM